MNPRKGSLADRLATTTTVVIVEDEADIAAFLGAFFRASGMGMAHVNPASADDALEAIASHDPACVLLDINLAGFSGLDVLAGIRADARLRDLPVLVVSANTSAETINEARRLGVSDFVAKPFSVSELFDQVAKLVEGPSADPGLVARAELDDRLTRLLHKAGQNEEPMSFALIRAADGSDERVVAALRAALPSDAVFGPGDDDEIAIIVPGSDARTTTGALAEVLAGVFATARAGVATAPDHAITGDELYMAADAALAEAVEQDQPVLTAR